MHFTLYQLVWFESYNIVALFNTELITRPVLNDPYQYTANIIGAY